MLGLPATPVLPLLSPSQGGQPLTVNSFTIVVNSRFSLVDSALPFWSRGTTVLCACRDFENQDAQGVSKQNNPG